ncbi:MAG: hypothetical protein ACMXX7_00545 [Candidatus Woesearchaeota archaeon]
MKGSVVGGIATLGFTLVSAIIFILISIIFFFLNVWIIKVAAGFAGYPNLDGNWVVFTAGIMSGASIISAALRR